MRIGFIGKGGSGKTSISSAFAIYLSKNQKVLFVDADVNAHAHECLSLEPTKPLGERQLEVSQYFSKNRTDIIPLQMIGSTPPSNESVLIRDTHNDQFIKSLSNSKDNLSLITVGTYTQQDSGVNCYHSKLMPFEMILHHTIDSSSDTIIMDATAGVDVLGTSLFMAFDVFFFIIEPTKKSLSVLKTFKDQTNAKVIPILNKVQSGEDIDFVKNQGVPVDIVIKHSEYLRFFEQGENESFERFISENSDVFERIKTLTNDKKQDKVSYYTNLVENYKKNCEAWYEKYYETNLFEKTNIDLEFLKSLSE